MPDINMYGLTYLQQISEASTGAGLHIEPGIWATVPHTTDPNEPASVVRMASIPHGTVILAQGVAQGSRAAHRTSRTTTCCRSSSGAPPRRTTISTR